MLNLIKKKRGDDLVFDELDETPRYVRTDRVRIVTSNLLITAKGLAGLSLKARKLFYIAISQCAKNDQEFFMYEISVKDFATLMGITSEAVYPEADKITDELLRGVIKIAKKDEQYFKKYSMFSMCEYSNNHMIRFKLNKDMTDFLLHLKKGFTQPLLDDFIKMKSPYSMAIWHIMQERMCSKKPGFTETVTFSISLEDLRSITGTENKFKKISQFKERVLDKAIREIKDNCGVVIKYENLKKGRSVVGFMFHATSEYYIDESRISQRTKDKVKMGLLRIESTRRELTEEEIDEYNKLEEKYNYELDFSDGNT